MDTVKICYPTFAPNDPLARAQFAQVLYRDSGTPDFAYESIFPDVTDNQWFTNAVIWNNSKK